MNLTNKIILVISPNYWGNVKLSKHHYTDELVKLGNKIYFLNPPSKASNGISIEEYGKNLFIIHHKTFFPFRLRSINRTIFYFLMQFHFKKIINALGEKPDVIWDFGNDLTYYNKGAHIPKGTFLISHPVDVVSDYYAKNVHRVSTVFFSVSDYILNQIQNVVKKDKYFIPHAISKELEKFASTKTIQAKVSKKVKVGYIGNLMLRLIDFNIFVEVIKDNPDVEFHLWGGYKLKDGSNNIGGDSSSEIERFVSFITNANNVVLHGHTPQKEILNSIEDIDLFFMCYDHKKHKGGNSHKLLEYLATGKVVVTTYLSAVKNEMNLDNLIVMEEEGRTESYSTLFRKVVNNIEQYNNLDLQKDRIQYTLNNTYEKNLNKIQKILLERFEEN